MDKKEADKVLDQKVQPLTPTQRKVPVWMTVGGSILLFLVLGMQQAISNDPDQYASWGDTKNIAMILGGIAALLGPYLQSVNNKTHEAALVEAAKAPPVDPEGNRSARITLITAMKQAALGDEDNDPDAALVHGIAQILFPTKAKLEAPEAPELKGGA